MIDIFRDKLGFDWEIVFPMENTVGTCHNGKCTGVMKLLAENVSYISIVCL